MPQAKRIGSSGSGLGDAEVAAILGTASRGGGSSRSGGSTSKAAPRRSKKEQAARAKFQKSKNPLLSFLDVIDTPRAAVVSLMNETNDALRGGDGEGFSVKDLFQQTGDNIGFNQYLENQGVDIDGLPGAAVGFAGDVALDPLTYLSLGSTALGKTGAKEIAEELVQKTAQGAISREVAQEAIEAIGKSGTASTLGRFPEAAKAVGWEGGLRAVAPGYGTVGRLTKMNKLLDRTAYGRAVGKGGKTLIKSGDRGIGAAEAIANPIQKIRNTRGAQAVRKAMSTKGQHTNDLFKAGASAEERMAAAELLSKKAVDRSGELRFAAQHQGEMKEILLAAKRMKLDGDLWDALGSGMDSASVQKFMATPGGAELLERTRTWFATLRQGVNDIAGAEVIPEAARYAPGVLEHAFRDEFKDVIQRFNTAGRGRKAFAEEARTLRPGATIKGVDAEGNFVEHTLLEPTQAGGASVRQQAEDFYSSVYGKDYQPIFKRNATDVFPIYLDALSRVAGREEGAAFLRKTGAGKSITKIIDESPDLADRVVAKAADIDKTYDSLDLGVEASAARKVFNESRLDYLDQRVIGGNVDSKLNREYRVRKAADSLYDQADELDAKSVELMDAGDVQGSYDSYQQAQFRRLGADDASRKAKDVAAGEPNMGFGNLRISDKDLEGVIKLMDDNVSQFANPARFGQNTVIEQDMLDMMSDYAKVNDPQSLRKFLRYYDAGTALLKRQQLATPGFLVRNYMGGKFMHFMDGIDIGAERRFMKMQNAAQSGDWSKLSPLDKEAWEAWEQGPVHLGGQVATEYDRNMLDPLSAKPWDKNFAPYRAIGKGNDWVENRLRGAHFTDAYKQAMEKGVTSEDAARSALDRMVKYHFDYDDLTGVERNVIRRIIPFYTWSRKAIPQMLDDMARKPGRVNNYFAAKENIERDVPIDPISPGFFAESGAWRLPFGSGDGAGQSYWMPDMPINSIDKYLGSNVGNTLQDSLSQMSPIIKTPLEVWRNKQFFKGIPLQDKDVEIPAHLSWLNPVLRSTGLADVNAEGQTVMKDRYFYVMDQFIPLLGRARRLAPSEEKYQERIMASWASFLGLGIRANTRYEQEKEIWRRYFAAKGSLDRAQDLGYAQDVKLPRVDVSDPSTLPDFILEGRTPNFRAGETG